MKLLIYFVMHILLGIVEKERPRIGDEWIPSTTEIEALLRQFCINSFGRMDACNPPEVILFTFVHFVVYMENG